MVITGYEGEYSIGRLTESQVNIILTIVQTVDKRCFEKRDSDGEWYSNDDFVLRLTDEERTELRKIGEAISLLLDE